MSSFDLVGLLKEELTKGQRPPDGLLHASGDLVGPLRHSQLKLAGAPYTENSIASQIRLETGTMWHNRLHAMIVGTGVPFMQEVKVNPWLPEGWGGTADWMIWDFDYEAFILRDLKTIKAEGLRWVLNGAKEEHIWQVSAYWWALDEAGFPLRDHAEVMYMPMNDTMDDVLIEPVLVEVDILDKDLVWGVMEDRWAATQQYLWSIEAGPHDLLQNPGYYVTDALAPVMERDQKVNWNGKQDVWDVKLVPHWSALFCPFDDELCDCGSQGITKIGHFTLEGAYEARNGYEDIQPLARPSASEVAMRRQEPVQL